MAEQQRQGYCQECDTHTLVKRNGVNHILHLLLSVFTLAIWVPVWIFLCLFKQGGWRCQQCGSDQIKDTGEMLGLRGWVVISLMALLVVPLVLTTVGGEGGRVLMQSLAPVLIWVPVIGIPVLAVLAYQHRRRKRQRIAPTRVPAKPTPTKPITASSARPDPVPNPPETRVAPQRQATPDTSAAEEFKRRMRNVDS